MTAQEVRMKKEKTLSLAEVAERLKVHPSTLTRWMQKKGYFPNAYKLDPAALNSPYRIPESDVVAFEVWQQHGGQAPFSDERGE